MGLVSLGGGEERAVPGSPRPVDLPASRKIESIGTSRSRNRIGILSRAGHLAPIMAELELEREELAGEREPVVGLGLIQEGLDPGPPAGPPVGLESLAGPVDPARLGERVVTSLGDRSSRHQATSSSASQVLRIRSSRRATVRRAQPSWAAISSQV